MARLCQLLSTSHANAFHVLLTRLPVLRGGSTLGGPLPYPLNSLKRECVVFISARKDISVVNSSVTNDAIFAARVTSMALKKTVITGMPGGSVG